MDEKSSFRLRDFAHRIELMQSDPVQEQAVRKFLAGIVTDCPMDVLTGIALRVVEIRRDELRNEMEQN